MRAEIASVSGRVLTPRVSGTLTQLELKSMQAASAKREELALPFTARGLRALGLTPTD